MVKTITKILVLTTLPLFILAGCASVNVGAKPRNEPPPVTRTDDSRPVANIRAENAQLRARQAELENTYQQWQVAVGREERTKNDLKAQRKRAKDDLKRAKKNKG